MNESTQLKSVPKSTKDKPKKHYVNNKDFYSAIVVYQEKFRKAKEEDKPLPPIPNYIGECLNKIANGLSQKGRFINYPATLKEDMISDGIENCLRYIMTFNPEKTTNAFAYFTETIKNAFFRRIDEEYKRMYYQYKLSERMAVLDETYDDGNSTQLDYSFIKAYEERLEEKKRKIKEKKLAKEQ